MRWKIARLVSTALMITLSPGSVRTISDALLAASVASATAIPISAFFRAGASLTPSPVIPQICFRACKRFTISYLCSGNTPAKPSAFSIRSSTGKAAIDSSLFCPNKADEGYMFVPIPKRRPVSFPIAS
uniref:Secreted protein n=1 Tax=Arundo donax TaxID=35708 RepID=A0A0A9CXS8_ARUDO